jgi:hypothetical protein
VITIYLGSRNPKKYEQDTDPVNPVLSADQPGFLKCRVKMRMSPEGTMNEWLQEARRCWEMLDHDDKPAWISGTDDQFVMVLAAVMGIPEIRKCEPSEGDE